LLAVKATAAHEQDRAQGKDLAQAVQAATGENVQLAYVDQSNTGTPSASHAAQHGMKLEVVNTRRPNGVLYCTPTLGRGAFLCLSGTFPQAGARLRTTATALASLPR